MRKFVLGMLAGWLAVFLFVVFVVLVTMAGRFSQPDLPREFALTVSLGGDIPERVDPDWLGLVASGDGNPRVDLFALTEAVRKAGEDERVKALILHGGGSQAGWAKAQELRWALEEFKESGKPVWAFFGVASREDYYIASLADRIVIQPESYLNLKGLRMEVMFFKETLDKLGVDAELVRTGKYKSAGEPFSRQEMSPEWREVLNSTLDEFYGQLLDAIAGGRGQDAAHWRAVLDNGPFVSGEAREHGLIDDVLFEDAFREELGEAVSVEDLADVGVAAYARDALPEASRGETVAVMHARGAIQSGSSWSDPLGAGRDILGSASFIRQLDSLREDDGIAGVILRVDSPGGDAIASEQMLRAVRRLGEAKPLVVSMATVAASGGYYIACAPDAPIIAYPGTYTGSIGVFTIALNLRELYGKLGISKEILTRGRFAAIDSDYKPLSPAEKEKLRQYVDSIYDTFVTRVAEGRGSEAEAIEDLAQGRVWIGAQALENGLVDELGGYREAVARVREVAELDEDAPIRLVNYPPLPTMLESLVARRPGVLSGRLLEAPVLQDLHAMWNALSHWAAGARGGPLLMAPFTLSVE